LDKAGTGTMEQDATENVNRHQLVLS